MSFNKSLSRIFVLTVIAIIFAFSLVGCGSDSPTSPMNGVLSGRVFHEGTVLPIPGAIVSVAGHSTTTDGEGDYELTGLPTGLQTISVTKDEYQHYSEKVNITANTTFDVHIEKVKSGGGDVEG